MAKNPKLCLSWPWAASNRLMRTMARDSSRFAFETASFDGVAEEVHFVFLVRLGLVVWNGAVESAPNPKTIGFAEKVKCGKQPRNFFKKLRFFRERDILVGFGLVLGYEIEVDVTFLFGVSLVTCCFVWLLREWGKILWVCFFHVDFLIFLGL